MIRNKWCQVNGENRTEELSHEISTVHDKEKWPSNDGEESNAADIWNLRSCLIKVARLIRVHTT